MGKIQIAIEIGGANIKIFRKGFGVVLSEPSLIALNGKNGSYTIKGFGFDAQALVGKMDEQSTVFSPIVGGEIKAHDYAVLMLKHFLQKVAEPKLFSTVEAVVIVPCGLSKEQRDEFASCCYDAKISTVRIVPSPIVSALGGGKFVDTPTTYFIVDIGGASTDVAVISMNSIIKGCTIGEGGNAMDNAIIDVVSEFYGLEISLVTAKQIKDEIGSLFEKDTQNIEIVGLDKETSLPKTTIIVSDVIRDYLEPFFERIAFAIESTINMCSPDISADIYRNGIFFCGGVANITGLEDYMRKRLKLSAHIMSNADNCAILGGGKLLSDEKQLQDIITNF